MKNNKAGRVGRVDSPARRSESAVEHLGVSLEQDGWTVSYQPRHADQTPSPDILCRRGNVAYAIELKSTAARARREVLRGLLADAILRARASAAAAHASPLAVVMAPALSDDMVKELAEYARDFGGGTAWGLFDTRGRFQFFGSELEALTPTTESSFAKAIVEQFHEKPSQLLNPFTDLGQWMLKVLLAPNFYDKNRHWLGYRRPPSKKIRSVTDLAKEAEVSIASASKLVRALQSSGHIEETQRAGLALVRVESLFAAWRAASRGPWKELPTRFALAGNDSLARVNKALDERKGKWNPGPEYSGKTNRIGEPGKRACLALFSAAAAVDHCVVTGAPIHLYVDSFSNQLVASLGLVPVDQAADAEVILRRPRFPESVFRGATMLPGKHDPHSIPASDLIQCWLDLSHHPSRGDQFAREIGQRLNYREWS